MLVHLVNGNILRKQVDGDTVTVTFEMRSGREHNTPDKAMWGFVITVRAQESTEEVFKSTHKFSCLDSRTETKMQCLC